MLGGVWNCNKKHHFSHWFNEIFQVPLNKENVNVMSDFAPTRGGVPVAHFNKLNMRYGPHSVLAGQHIIRQIWEQSSSY